MALIKRIVLFTTSLFFIIILLVGATSGFAKSFPAAAGRGALDCERFIDVTNEMDDDGILSGRSYIYRLEYIQWAFGFLTAFNIRHYEREKHFKDFTLITSKEISCEKVYDMLVNSCNLINEDNQYDFSQAVYMIFSRLPGESI